MKPLSLLRLALAGSRTDTLRVALTAFSAALAMVAILAAATVIAIPEVGTQTNTGSGRVVSNYLNEQYSSAYLREPGLRPGVTTAIVLLVIPCLVLAAQCGRLGAPARDRRLASVRLAGATPRQAVKLVATETGIASALGAVVGLVIYLVARQLLHSPRADGTLPLPTDIELSWLTLALLVTVFPALATLVAVVALRKVTVGPFGVVRRERTGQPRVWPGFLIVPGIALVALLEPITRYANEHGTVLPDTFFLAMVGSGALLTIVGVIFGTGWISYATGRVLVRYARRASAVLAGRRLIADPWAGSRAFAVVLTCVVFAAGAAGVKAAFTADFAQDVGRQADEADGNVVYEPADRSFYYDAFDLINTAVLIAAVIAAGGLLVTVTEGIVSRRRTYAHLAASGVPRSAMSKAVVWQSIAPLAPATVIALVAGIALPRALFGTEYRSGGSNGQPETIIAVQIPLGELALFGAIAVLIVAMAVGVGLLFLRPSTHPAELRTG